MAYQPKSYRKFLAGTVSAAVVASAIAPVASASFTDVAGSVHANDIATLVAKGYIKGYADGTFKPNKPLTRGEAAIIFSRILKDAGVKAPEQGAGFPDVPASKAELAEAVAIVKAAGVMGGDEKGNFNPNANITREQMAKVVVEAFKLPKPPANYTTKVTDLDKAGSWAREYIQTLEANGVTKNTEFAPKQNVTRGQFASFVVRAMDVKKEVSAADITAVKLVDEKTLEVTFNGELKEVKKEDFAIQGVEIESVSIKAAAAAEAKTTVVVIKTKTALEEGKTYSVSYKGQTTDKAKVDVPVVTPKVESVSAINAKQLVIKFNKEVNVDSVLDANGNLLANVVSLDGVSLTGSAGSFDATKKELTVTLSTPLTKGTEYTVTVDNVLMPNAEKFPKYSTAFKADETVVPTVKSVTSVTKDAKTRTVTIEFSEPVSFNSIKVNGKFVSAVNADSGFGAKYTLTTPEDLTAGQTYEVEINGLKDSFGNAAENLLKTSVTVVSDTVKPTFTVTPVDEKTIDVVFNKEMNASVAVDSFTVTKVDSQGNTVTLAQSGLAVRKTDKKSFRITLANAPFDNTTQTSKEVSVTVKNLTDSLGNAVDATTAKVTIVRDTVKPTVKSVKVVPGTQNQVEVEFSEAVTGINTSDFALTDANGNDVKTSAGSTITVSSVSGASTNSNNKVTLTLSANLPATGTYKLVLKQGQVTDTSTSANTNDAQVVAFGYTKPVTVAPQLTATITNDSDAGAAGTQATASGTAAARKVVINFNQPDVLNGLSNSTGTYVDGAADNPANYTLNGAALPKGTVVTFNDGGAGNDSVTLDFSGVADADLPVALKEGGSIAISVANVKTAAGSTLAYTTNQVTVADTTKPSLLNAYIQKVGTSYVITASYSEELTTTGLDADDFTLVHGATPTPINLADATPATVALDSNDKTKVVITITHATDVAAIDAVYATDSFTFGTAATTTTQDKAANTIKANDSKVVQKY